MLNGLWMLEVTDSHGMRARGLVLLRDGAVLGNGEAIDIAGTYETHEGAILATLHVVLYGRRLGGEIIAERVHLHVQGAAIGNVITASATFSEDAGRRADIRLQLWAATNQPQLGLSAPTSPAANRPLWSTSTLSNPISKCSSSPNRPEIGPKSGEQLRHGPVPHPTQTWPLEKSRSPRTERDEAQLFKSAFDDIGSAA